MIGKSVRRRVRSMLRTRVHIDYHACKKKARTMQKKANFQCFQNFDKVSLGKFQLAMDLKKATHNMKPARRIRDFAIFPNLQVWQTTRQTRSAEIKIKTRKK